MAARAQEALPVDVARCAAAADMQVTWRYEVPAAWQRAVAALDYVPVSYSADWIDYQLAYQRGHGGTWWDASMVLHHDRQPCGVWPVSVSAAPEGITVSAHGFPLMPPLFVGELRDKSRKAAVQACLNMWEALCSEARILTGESAESFSGELESGLSEWHQQSMRRGARAKVRHDLFVDLTLQLDTIRARYRKSYRPLINAGTRAWKVGEMHTVQPDLWNAYRDLHLKVAGRVTRSALSWQLNQEAIANGNAFLIYLLDEYENMVGGGFFMLTRDEGAYAVGAYDRSLFDKPLGHVVQHRAIEALQQRGVRWYRIGSRPFASEEPQPTAKAISIAEFKQGFATHVFPKYVLEHEFKITEPH